MVVFERILLLFEIKALSTEITQLSQEEDTVKKLNTNIETLQN